jgi:hypothetical protein
VLRSGTGRLWTKVSGGIEKRLGGGSTNREWKDEMLAAVEGTDIRVD